MNPFTRILITTAVASAALIFAEGFANLKETQHPSFGKLLEASAQSAEMIGMNASNAPLIAATALWSVTGGIAVLVGLGMGGHYRNILLLIAAYIGYRLFTTF